MVDIGQISAAFASLNAAKDLASAMIGLRDASVIDGKVGEFNAKLVEAQSAVFSVNQERATLIETVRNLEQKIAQLEDWRAEKQRYELQEIQPGVFAYGLKPIAAMGEPDHQICANCYNLGKKSILQGAKLKYAGIEVRKCHQCSSELKYYRGDLPKPPPVTPRSRASGWMGS